MFQSAFEKDVELFAYSIFYSSSQLSYDQMSQNSYNYKQNSNVNNKSISSENAYYPNSNIDSLFDMKKKDSPIHETEYSNDQNNNHELDRYSTLGNAFCNFWLNDETSVQSNQTKTRSNVSVASKRIKKNNKKSSCFDSSQNNLDFSKKAESLKKELILEETNIFESNKLENSIESKIELSKTPSINVEYKRDFLKNPTNLTELLQENFYFEKTHRKTINNIIHVRIMDNIYPVKQSRIITKMTEQKFGYLLENFKKINKISYSPIKKYFLLNIEEKDFKNSSLCASVKALEFLKISFFNLEIQAYNDMTSALDKNFSKLINTSYFNSLSNVINNKQNIRTYTNKLNIQTKRYIISMPYISTTTKTDYFMKREEIVSYKISENFMDLIRLDKNNLEMINWYSVLNCVCCNNQIGYWNTKFYEANNIVEGDYFVQRNLEKPDLHSTDFNIKDLDNVNIGSKVCEWVEEYNIGADKYNETFLVIQG